MQTKAVSGAASRKPPDCGCSPMSFRRTVGVTRRRSHEAGVRGERWNSIVMPTAMSAGRA